MYQTARLIYRMAVDSAECAFTVNQWRLGMTFGSLIK
jgi:hypothetical protein